MAEVVLGDLRPVVASRSLKFLAVASTLAVLPVYWTELVESLL